MFFKHYKGRLIIMMICGALMSVCQATVPPLFGYLFNRVFSQGSLGQEQLDILDKVFAATTGNSPQDLVWAIPAACIVIYFFNGTFRYIHMFIMRYTGDKVANQIRVRLLEKYLELNLTFHSKYASGSGGLLSRTLNDVYTIQNSTGLIADLVREPILAALLIALMIHEDWKLTATIFIAVPVLAFILNSLAKSLRKYAHLHQEVLESLTETLKEALDGVKIIQSFNLGDKVAGEFKKRARRYLMTRRKIVSREEFSGPISELVAAFVFAGMVFYFGHGVINGDMTPGSFLSFVAAMGFMQKPIKKIQEAFIRVQQTMVSTERVFTILNDDRVVKEAENTLPFPSNWKEIQFKNVSFSYEADTVLNRFNINVKRGEVIALVGSSGSGKSTLMNLLERFFDPCEGTICFDGVSTLEMNLKDLRRNIALVTQDVFLFNDTIANNIRFGDLSNKNGDIRAAAQAANAYDFIQKLPNRFENKVGERGNLLSGGEKQRISIARAIYKDAPIIILDEATSALDSVSEIEVQKGLEKLMEGRTVFVIAHRLSTIKSADRILVLDKGSIVEQGTHEELLAKKAEYFNFHQIQMSEAAPAE